MSSGSAPKPSAPILAVLAAAAVLSLAGCGDAEPAGGAGGSTSGVTTRDDPRLGTILTDAAGRTLYFAEQETDGGIRCTAGCLRVWKPMEMPQGASADARIADLGVLRRPDTGQQQLTYRGKPLYTFVRDAGPGEVGGDNVRDAFDGTGLVWHAAVVDGAPPGGGPEPTADGGYGY